MTKPTGLIVKRVVICFHLVFLAAFTTGLIVTIQQLLSTHNPASEQVLSHGKTARLYYDLTQRVGNLEKLQSTHGVSVASTPQLTQGLADIQLDLQVGQRLHARKEIEDFNHQLDEHFSQLNAQIAAQTIQQSTDPAQAGSGRDIPILLYHHPPTDFDAQLTHLEQSGYTTIDLTELALGLTGHAPLPAKPIVITLDDGFADQESAASALEAHHMKATFYIINGGEASKYCIGANRHPGACGDSYLTWDQIRKLDRNPLFSVESHTNDHLELAKQPIEVQRFQIIEGKRGLEAELGHPVYHFCYPYGSFNDTTLQIAHEAGFITATTTVPGTFQSGDGLYALKRIRDTYGLQ